MQADVYILAVKRGCDRLALTGDIPHWQLVSAAARMRSEPWWSTVPTRDEPASVSGEFQCR